MSALSLARCVGACARLAGAIVLGLGAVVCQPSQAETAATVTTPRPRVGLVLGGGGAKGAAHVGVLQVLDEMHIPVDCIVGTSMGALVGGIYASGKSAKEVDSLVRKIDWRETLAFASLREELPMRRKQAGITYSNSLEFGIRNGGIAAPAGFINSQHVEQTIRKLAHTASAKDDFDELPIPFRSVATDMQTGEMVVFDHGDLSMAMRASMAVPGVFSPAVMEERVLGDGGLVRNLPVDVARSSCADVVIAVWLKTPTPDRDTLLSPLALISRSLDVVIDSNVRQQLDTLTAQDVAIAIDMRDIGSADFDRIEQAIPLGRIAARAHQAELARFAVSEAEYGAWRQSKIAQQNTRTTVADIEIKHLERVNASYVESSLEIKPGMTVTDRKLDDQVADVFALGDFESVSYRLRGDPARALLEIDAIEKSWGPRFLRFDLGLAASTEGETPFVLRADYLHHWINSAGGEIHGAAQLGRTTLLEASLYQPIDVRHEWFVEPAIQLKRSLEDVYLDGDTVARLDLRQAYGEVDFGRTFGRSVELRLGVRGGAARTEPDIAVPGLIATSNEAQNAWTAKAIYDTRNTPLLPTRGWLARIDYLRSEKGLGSDGNYERLDGLVQTAMPYKHDVVILSVAGGTSFNSALPPNYTFTLGGPESFPGFRIGELRGMEYWTGSVSYLRKIADISQLFGQALYLGIQAQVGSMQQPALEQGDLYQGRLYSGSVFVTGRTPIGPMTVSIGVASSHSWLLSIGLGRPIEEGTIMDFAR
ncbi:MAG TPA: patatin-like phospholipase family protein [Povalibacter sp.]|nr:patatin-like phospholipase family protein [Povalibacter sp.]